MRQQSPCATFVVEYRRFVVRLVLVIEDVESAREGSKSRQNAICATARRTTAQIYPDSRVPSFTWHKLSIKKVEGAHS